MGTTAALPGGVWVQRGALCHQSWLEVEAVKYLVVGWRMSVVALAQHQGAALTECLLLASA